MLDYFSEWTSIFRCFFKNIIRVTFLKSKIKAAFSFSCFSMSNQFIFTDWQLNWYNLKDTVQIAVMMLLHKLSSEPSSNQSWKTMLETPATWSWHPKLVNSHRHSCEIVQLWNRDKQFISSKLKKQILLFIKLNKPCCPSFFFLFFFAVGTFWRMQLSDKSSCLRLIGFHKAPIQSMDVPC